MTGSSLTRVAGCNSSRQPPSVRGTTTTPGQGMAPSGQLTTANSCLNPENIRSLKKNIRNRQYNAFLEAGLSGSTGDDLQNRSLCRWHYEPQAGRTDRYPRQIPEAVCESRTCRGMEDRLCRCEEVWVKLLVGVRKQCPDGRQIWVYELEDHQVACLCALPRLAL